MDRSHQPAAVTTVILLGTDTPIGLAVIRDLGRHGYRVIGIGRSAGAIGGASRYCHYHAVRAGGGEALVAQMLDLAARYEATVLLAISESDLLDLNDHRAALEARLAVLTPDAAALDKVLDKAVCQAEAAAVGIRVPRTLQIANLEELAVASRELTFPVVLKWADPNLVGDRLRAAGLDVIKAEFALDGDELRSKLAPYGDLGIFPMVQEYCPGHGLGQMFLARDGEALLEFQHERLHEWPPEGGGSTLCRSVPLTEHADQRALSRALLQRLKWTGVAMVEYRFDPATKSYVFMEINGRFWGSLPLAISAGVPFASGLVAALGGPDRALPPQAPYRRITSLFWIPETRRLLRVLFQRSAIVDPMFKAEPWRDLVTFVTLYFRPSTRFFVFQLADPKPFFADLWNVLLKVKDRLTGSSTA